MKEPKLTTKFAKIVKDKAARLYFVGGCVRDSILGIEPKDYDLVCEGLTFSALKEIATDFFDEVKEKKAGFPVLFCRKDSEKYELSICRVDQSTGSKHTDFTTKPVKTIQEDLGRRDFTINAMAQDILTGEIIDPFYGALDLKNQILRPVFKRWCAEDPLRLLRAVKFIARFNLKWEGMDPDEIEEQKKNLSYVSDERISDELIAWLSASYPRQGAGFFFHYNLYDLKFPAHTPFIQWNEEDLDYNYLVLADIFEYGQSKIFLQDQLVTLNRKHRERLENIRRFCHEAAQKTSFGTRVNIFKFSLAGKDIALGASYILCLGTAVHSGIRDSMYPEIPGKREDLQISTEEICRIVHIKPPSPTIGEIHQKMLWDIIGGELLNTEKDLKFWLERRKHVYMETIQKKEKTSANSGRKS